MAAALTRVGETMGVISISTSAMFGSAHGEGDAPLARQRALLRLRRHRNRLIKRGGIQRRISNEASGLTIPHMGLTMNLSRRVAPLWLRVVSVREEVLAHVNVESEEGGAVGLGSRLDLDFPRTALIKPC